MNLASLGPRALRRLRRELDARRHAAADGKLVSRYRNGELLPDSDLALVADRMAGRPWLPGPLLELLQEVCFGNRPPGEDRALARACTNDAAEVVRDEITLFGRVYPLAHDEAWHRDPLRDRPWPVQAHARIRLDDPERPGDLRMQWEAARFHHAVLLARAHAATEERAYLDAFLRQTASFERGSPPFCSIHWSLGMEVAIRAAAWVLALALFRGPRGPEEKERLRLTRSLGLHGVFLETHLERHRLGFTTNHTLSDYAGLAVLGRHFQGTAAGDRWLRLAAEGLRACLEEQVLAGGAHAECSLPYERFTLEAALVAALCLEEADASRIEPALCLMAEHLAASRLPSGLPFIGDGDDSFFPPFGFPPYEAREPLQADLALACTRAWLCAREKQRLITSAPDPVRYAVVESSPADPGRTAEDEGVISGLAGGPAVYQPGSGLIRFSAGPYEGALVARSQEEKWLPTHGHNDLLSLVLDVNGECLLIDPGTGGYGWDRQLRHRLRGTAAHSTLQWESREQSELRERATFDGPAPVLCRARVLQDHPLHLEAWHEGFGHRIRHRRRILWFGNRLWIEDLLYSTDSAGAWGPSVLADAPAGSATTSHIRFRLPPGRAPLPVRSGPARSTGRPGPSICEYPLSRGRVRFLLLRPRGAIWQIQPGFVSRRYAEVREAPLLLGSSRGPWPHRWLTALEYVADEGVRAE